MNYQPSRRSQEKKRRSVSTFEMVVLYIFVYGGIALIATLIIAKLGEWAWNAVKDLIRAIWG